MNNPVDGVRDSAARDTASCPPEGAGPTPAPTLEPSPQTPEAAPAQADSPYKELRYYEECDSDRFAGRERDIHEVVARVETERAFVLYGRSGLGKTSLLLAGIFPVLRTRSYRPVYVRTLENPLSDLRQAIARDCKVSDVGGDLRELLKAACSGVEIPVLVLDQFEEFFTRFKDRPRDRAAFVREVSTVIADPTSDVRVIFSLREDYLAALDDFQRRLPELFASSYRLAPLSAFGAREAIIRPLVRKGVPYDERLVTRLVDELAKFEFDSARLQVTCAELYRTACAASRGDLRLTESDLERLEVDLTKARRSSAESGPTARLAPAEGEPLLAGIFHRYLDQAIAPVEAKYPLLGRLILDAMITREKTKCAISLNDLHKLGSTAEVEDALTMLVQRNLVRTELRGERPWYELIHECLVEEIRRWLDQNRDFSRFCAARNFIVDGARGSLWRDDLGALLNTDKLVDLIGHYREKLQLDVVQKEFVLRSVFHCRSSDANVAYWASEYGEEETRALLLELLKNPDSKVRLGAAWAVGYINDEDDELLKKCLSLALDPQQETEIQRAAGQSLAMRGREKHLEPIREAVQSGDMPEHVQELLADLAEHNRLRGIAPLWLQWHARRRVEGRIRRLCASDIEQSKWPSIKEGALAGMLWAMLIIAPSEIINIVLQWLLWLWSKLTLEPDTNMPVYGEVFWRMVVILLLAASGGAVLGYRAGMAKVITKRFRLPHPGTHAVHLSFPILWITPLVALLLLADLFIQLSHSGFGDVFPDFVLALFAILFWLVIWRELLAWGVDATRICFGLDSISPDSFSRKLAVLVLILGGLQIPLTGFLFFRQSYVHEVWERLIMISFYCYSASLFVMAITLAELAQSGVNTEGSSRRQDGASRPDLLSMLSKRGRPSSGE